MNNKNGFILSTYVYMLLVFFLLLLTTMLAVMNNTKLLSNKLKEQSGNTSGLSDKDFSFVLLGEGDMVIKKGEEYIDPGFKIQTSKKKDLSDIVNITGNVDVNNSNTYKLTYSATYNGITKKLTRNVTVLDNIAANYVRGLYNYKRDENGLIKDNTSDQNIRYAGSDDVVKNYVEFGNTGELWRIIGVFDVSSEVGGNKIPRVKIVRNESIGSFSWDSSDSSINKGYGVNEWSESDIKTMLNTYYLGESNSCKYCSDMGQGTCTNDCSTLINPLKSDFVNMVDNVVWNTGSLDYVEGFSLIDVYNSERSSNLGDSLCSSKQVTYCTDSVVRKSEWLGKIGLIYASDYGYASADKGCAINLYGTSSACINNNYLRKEYYWTITVESYTDVAALVWAIQDKYSVYGGNIYMPLPIYPSLYLKESVKITSGDGTQESPYKLSV